MRLLLKSGMLSTSTSVQLTHFLHSKTVQKPNFTNHTRYNRSGAIALAALQICLRFTCRRCPMKCKKVGVTDEEADSTTSRRSQFSIVPNTNYFVRSWRHCRIKSKTIESTGSLNCTAAISRRMLVQSSNYRAW